MKLIRDRYRAPSEYDGNLLFELAIVFAYVWARLFGPASGWRMAWRIDPAEAQRVGEKCIAHVNALADESERIDRLKNPQDYRLEQNV